MVARDQDLRLPQLFDCQIEDPHQAHQLTQEEEVKQWSAVRLLAFGRAQPRVQSGFDGLSCCVLPGMRPPRLVMAMRRRTKVS